MYKILMIVGSFVAVVMFGGCVTKEIKVLDKKCAKPSIDMSKFTPPKAVKFRVHKGDFVVTIKKSDYVKMKETNQDIKDRYVSLREWVLVNIEAGMIEKK